MNVAIVLAGGIGTRLGDEIPKQYINVAGKPVISYCLDILAMHPMIDAIQIVADISWHGFIRQCMNDEEYINKWKGFSNPGQNRQLSIFHALEDILQYAPDDTTVIVHDAARPMLSSELVSKCLQAAIGHDGALPVLPMKDTVYFSEDGCRVSSLLKREAVFAGQAPEVFRLGTYYKANKSLLPDQIFSINGSTEPAIMSGMDIVMIDGDENNFKITTAEDLERFRQKIAARNGGSL